MQALIAQAQPIVPTDQFVLAQPIDYLVMGLTIAVVVFVGLVVTIRFFPGLLRSEFTDIISKEADLQKKIASLQALVELLQQQLMEARAEAKGLMIELTQLRNVAGAPIKAKVAEIRALGVWPVAKDLDLVEDALALYDTGVQYRALTQEEANRSGVVRELARFKPAVVVIGAEGGSQGIKLSDGIARPGWWGDVAKQYTVKTFVVLADHSSQPDILSVADALFRAGVTAVISVDSTITDQDAVLFLRMFFEKLTEGATVADAVRFARLIVSDGAAEAIRVRVA